MRLKQEEIDVLKQKLYSLSSSVKLYLFRYNLRIQIYS